MGMGYEQWLADRQERDRQEQAERRARRQVAVEQARQEWVHCRVYYIHQQPGCVRCSFAWVESIGSDGMVHLLYEEGSAESWVVFESLGHSITHANGKP